MVGTCKLAPVGGHPTGRLRCRAQLETVQGHHLASLACKPWADSPGGRQTAPRSTTSVTAPSRPPCTGWCSSMAARGAPVASSTGQPSALQPSATTGSAAIMGSIASIAACSGQSAGRRQLVSASMGSAQSTSQARQPSANAAPRGSNSAKLGAAARRRRGQRPALPCVRAALADCRPGPRRAMRRRRPGRPAEQDYPVRPRARHARHATQRPPVPLSRRRPAVASSTVDRSPQPPRQQARPLRACARAGGPPPSHAAASR